MTRSAGLGALLSAMFAATVQWRLLLLWLLIMLIPATVVALPLSGMLGGLLDHSVHAPEWAQQFNAIMFTDVLFALSDHAQWFGATAVLGAMLAWLLSPFIGGMIVGSGRAGHALGFASLLHSGLVEYGRMFRVMLWSLLAYAVVFAVAGGASHIVGKQAEQAVLESQVDSYRHVAHGVLLVVFVLMQAIVESARAAFIADTGLRSATRAMWRGIRQLIRHPLRTLLFYLVVTIIGTALASLFGVLRIHFATAFFVALLFSQLIVLAIGWMRIARLYALGAVARLVAPV